ncbi:protein S100-B-like [Rhinatrema bivittatum]|uniref:protein S100-B-like n=1 Tax=Rhinatrema bivittatum TaxID=194408 RepID=UPI00112BEE63|nr:protein S100-B-like [Rhinatrema bivittatum]
MSAALRSTVFHLGTDLGKEKQTPSANWEELTELENAMVTIMKVFHLYSGHQCKLKKADLRKLISKELPQFIQEIQDPQILDQLIADLDINGDLEIDFQEYSTLVAMVTAACQQFFVQKESE